MTPTENWPKPWMLSIHEQAVNEGFVWIEPISEADAKSLRDRMYRIRRRSDSSMAAFIRPEYHLVMIGRWERVTDANDNSHSSDKGEPLGRLPIIYNKRSDGKPLPTIRRATGEEVEAYTPAPQLTEPAPALTVNPEDLAIKPGEVDDLVSNLRNAARRRQQGDEQ